jgi:hypothetical protein
MCALLLAACCPVPLQQQSTAFRAVVSGISPDEAMLHLKRTANAPLLSVTVTDGVLRSSSGERLSLTAFGVGDSVYVQGSLNVAGDLRATVVRRLE